MNRTIHHIIAGTLVLGACTLTEAASEDVTSIAQPDLAELADAPSMAHPQPERPICAICGSDFGDPNVANDDPLNMIINSEYIGLIEEVKYIAYEPAGKTSYLLDQSVVDDLNDPNTYETIVMFDTPDLYKAMLKFTIDGTVYYEPTVILGD